jgi:coenzyme PQQ biosynthesis protein PqqD
MGAVPEGSRPLRRADVLAQSAGDTVILLTPDAGEYFTLNEVGGRIWALADGTRTVSEIVQALVAEYDAPRSAIEADTLELLEELTEQDLVRDAGSLR